MTATRAAMAGSLLVVTVGYAASGLAAQSACVDWTLTETLTIGSPDGAVLPMGASDVEIADDGTIYVTEFQTPHVSVFDPQGGLLRTFGRAGRGPGEFVFGAGRMGWVGDTLWVGDTETIHYFGPDGSEVRRLDRRAVVPHPVAPYRIRSAVPVVDGTMIGSDMDVYGGIERGYHPVVRLSSDRELLNEIARIPVPGRYVQSDEIGIFIPPFAPLPTPVVEPDGAGILSVTEGERSGTFELLRQSLDGDTTMRRSVAYDPVRITRREGRRILDEYADFRTANRGAFETATPARVRQLIHDEIDVPSHHMPVRELVAGHDGSIWLLRERGPAGEDRWEVYTRSGMLDGVVTVRDGRSSPFPGTPRLRIIRAGRSEIWGTTIDDFDVQYLHRFRVESTCGPRRDPRSSDRPTVAARPWP